MNGERGGERKKQRYIKKQKDRRKGERRHTERQRRIKIEKRFEYKGFRKKYN